MAEDAKKETLIITDPGRSLPTLEDFFYNDLEGFDSYQLPETSKEMFYQEAPPETAEFLGYSANGSLLTIKVPKDAFDLSIPGIVANSISGNSIRIDLSKAEYDGYDTVKTKLEAFKTDPKMSAYYATIGANNTDLIERNGMQYAANLRLLFTNIPNVPRFTTYDVNTKEITDRTYGAIKESNGLYIYCATPYPYTIERKLDSRNNIIWSCPNYNNVVANTTYKDTDVLHFIKKDGKYYQVIPLEASGNKTNVLVLNHDNSDKEEVTKGYVAKNLLIQNLEEAKDIRVVLDVNSLENRASNSAYLEKYPLDYKDTGVFTNMANYVKDLGNQLFDESYYKYAGYLPYGLDKYHRIHGVIYVQKEVANPNTGEKELVWFNLNKMLIANTNDISAPTNATGASNRYHIDYGPTALKPYTYDYANRTYVDNFWSEVGTFEKQRRQTQANIFRQTPLVDLFPSGANDSYKTEDDVLYKWTVSLGDTTFFIPPESIRVVSQHETDRIPIMRARGTIAKDRMRSMQYVELNLFFNDDRGINGVAYETVSPNGKQHFTYKMNGFRSLLAQMKFTPFLPITNQYINETLGIFAVCIERINLSTVPGFPALLQAQILLSKFNYQVYMPEVPNPENDSSVSTNTMNPFSACINYDTMRWYYQRCIMLGDELDRLLNIEDEAKRITVNSLEFYKRTIFANRTALLPYHFKDPTISLYIADEDHLKRLLQIKQDAAKKNENVTDNFEPNYNEARLIKECAQLANNNAIQNIYAKHIGKINAMMAALDRVKHSGNELVEDGSGNKVRLTYGMLAKLGGHVTAEYNGKEYPLANQNINHEFLDDWMYKPMLQEFETLAASLLNENGEPIINSVSIQNETLVIKINTRYASKEEIGKVIKESTVYNKKSGAGTKLSPDEIFKDSSIVLKLTYGNGSLYTNFEDACKAIQSLYGSSNVINPNADINDTLPFLDWCKTQGADIVAANEEAAALKQSIDLENVRSLKYNQILKDVVVAQFSAGVSNTYARIGTSGVDGAAPQYMGGQDTKLSWTIETKDEFIVSTFKSIPELTAYYSRVYRKVLPTYPIKIDSEFSRLIGVQEVSIDNVVVNTVPGFPGLYNIVINATSTDRTLRNKEALTLLELENQNLVNSRTKKQVDIRNDKELVQKFTEAEVYPDLELPKIKELGELGWRYIRYRAKERNAEEFYIDPDFYFVYPHLTVAKAIAEAMRCAFDEDLRNKLDENDIAQYLTDTSGGRLTIKNNGGIAKDSANQIAKEDIKDREALKINQAKQDRLYYTDILKSAAFRIPFGSWNISKTVRCSFMEPYYISETEWNENLEEHTYEIKTTNTESEYLEQLASKVSPKYKQIRFVDENGEELLTQINPNWNEEESQKILNLVSQFETCAKDLESQLKEHDGNISSTSIFSHIANFLAAINKTIGEANTAPGVIQPETRDIFAEALQNNLRNTYTSSQVFKSLSDNNFWKYTSKYNIFGKGAGTDDNPFSAEDETKNTVTLTEISYLIQAVADAISGKEECSTKNKNNRFGTEQWQADFNQIRIVNGEELLSSYDDVTKKNATSFGIFGIKKYTFEQLYLILPPEEKKELETSFEKDNEQFYVLDPYWRYKSNDEKIKYLYACALDPLVCMNAFIRNVIWYFAKMLRYRIIPSIEFDFKRQDNINTSNAKENASEFLQKIGMNQPQQSALFTELKAFAKNNGKALDAGKIFAAIILALTEEGFGKNTIFDMYNTRNYAELNHLIQTVTSLKYKARNENNPNFPKRNNLLRRYLLALYGYGVIPDAHNIGSDVKASPADKFLTNYNTKLALEACNNPLQYMRDSFYDMIRNDYRGRMLRAFPAFYMVFVDEGREFGLWKLHDNFYSTNALCEIQIVKSRKIPADTCKLTLSNMFETFTNNDEDTTINYKGNLGDLIDSFFDPKSEAEKAELRRINANKIHRAKLQAGVRIHVRLGYGANAFDLPCCFNGVIADIKPGELVQVIAQGDGIELCNPLYIDMMADEIQNSDKPFWEKITLPNNCICGDTPKHILQSLLTAKGGYMAAWLRNQYRKNKGQTAESAQKLIEENAENASKTDLLSDDNFIKYTLLNTFKNNPYGIRHFGDPDYRDIFIQGEPAQNLYEITNKSNSIFAEDLSNHVYFGDGSLDLDNKLYEYNLFDDLNLPYISFKPYGRTIWEIMHICKSIAPDYMTGITDFEFRSTVFLGKPHYYYAYKYAQDGDGQTVYEKRKPFQQWHIYNNYSDIVDNKISASSEKMKTNATGTYEVDGTEQIQKTAPMWVDADIYPEYQKSMIVDTKLYGKSWLKHNAVTGYISNIPIIRSLFDIGAQFMNFLDDNFASWFDNRGSIQSHATRAEDVVINALKDSVKEMYQGYMIILGDPSVKPNDRINITDTYEDMTGLCDVREVIHNMSAYHGYTTTITPDAISAHEIQNEIIKMNTWARFYARCLQSEVISLGGGVLGEYLYANGSATVQYAERAFTKFIRNAKTGTKVLNTLKGAKSADASIGILKSLGTKATGLAGQGVKALVPKLVGTFAVTIVCGAVNTALYRAIKGMQTLYIFPLRKFNKAFIAGLDGHQGLVYGTAQFNTPGPIEQLVGKLFAHSKHSGIRGVISDVLRGVFLDEQVMEAADRFDKEENDLEDKDLIKASILNDTKTLTEMQAQSVAGPQLEKAFSQPNSAFAMSLMPRTMVDGIQREWMPSKDDNKKTIWQAVKNRYYVDNPKTWPSNPNLRNLILLEENPRLKFFFDAGFLRTLPQAIAENIGNSDFNKDNIISYSVSIDSNASKQILGVKRTEKQKTGTAVVIDIPYTSLEGLVFLTELCKFIQVNTDYLKQPDAFANKQNNKDTSIVISSSLIVGSAHPLYGSGFHFILTGTGKLGENGALRKHIQAYYDVIANKLKQRSGNYDHLPMFTIEKMSKENEVGIMLAPTSPFSNNIVSKEEFKLEEQNMPKDTETTKKNENAKPLRKADYPENVYFSPLDGLGRAGMAYANINYDLIQRSTKKPRQELSAIYPSGWKQISYNENGQTKYLYNRAHLIAHSLCGEEANPANLITGTADFNAGENRDNMNTYEKQVTEYCRLHPNHTVIYKVTPVYEGNNLVASYVIMEATDTTFDKVLFNVTVYNTQKGWNIDYKTGNAEKQ